MIFQLIFDPSQVPHLTCFQEQGGWGTWLIWSQKNTPFTLDSTTFRPETAIIWLHGFCSLSFGTLDEEWRKSFFGVTRVSNFPSWWLLRLDLTFKNGRTMWQANFGPEQFLCLSFLAKGPNLSFMPNLVVCSIAIGCCLICNCQLQWVSFAKWNLKTKYHCLLHWYV